MHHIGPCHVANGTYSILCHTVLMMRTHSTESQLLLQMFTVEAELGRIKDTIIGMNEFYLHPCIGSFSLKG
jgi:hypothetical protein